MKKALYLLFFLILPSCLVAQDNIERTWLWQISGGELVGKSFIYGTVPVKDSAFFQFNSRVIKSLDKTDVFISFDSPSNATYSSILEKTLNKYDVHYGATPSQYLKSIAVSEQKPTVFLSEENSLSSIFDGSNYSNNSASKNQLNALKEAYLSANLSVFIDQRVNLDLSKEAFQTLNNRNNYKITNELIDKMRIQPAFIAVDGIYLLGNEGLLSLLKARGFQVKAVAVKEYEKVAEQIAYQKQLAQQWTQTPQPQKTTGSEQPISSQGEDITPPNQVTQPVRLDLPIGILNLAQWSTYQLKDSIFSYSAPQRLKSSNEKTESYSTRYGELEYKIDFVAPWEDEKIAIEQVIIQNGGQLVVKNEFANQSVRGTLIELMYTENVISKHLLLKGNTNNIIVTVKGETPKIHTILADRFLQSFTFKQAPIIDNGLPKETVNITEEETQPVMSWQSVVIEKMRLSLPSGAELNSGLTKDSLSVKSLVSDKVIDNNTIVVVASNKQDVFDNFKLFNSAINTAAAEVRGIVVDRNVMPVGRPNFAEYLVKNSIEQHYRILYYYQNNTFYQVIIKGDKKSVYNPYAETIIQSIFIN